ncbi:MAG: DUF131 domain-containing protein [Staphylothermus sp.]|nr:DUF131 domain-containing protein [Staphylothermus sp.]
MVNQTNILWPDYLFYGIIIGIALIFVGFLIIFIGMFSGTRKEGHVETGGVIIIGPIPIVFGSSKNISLLMLILAIVLTTLVLLTYIIGLKGWT